MHDGTSTHISTSWAVLHLMSIDEPPLPHRSPFGSLKTTEATTSDNYFRFMTCGVGAKAVAAMSTWPHTTTNTETNGSRARIHHGTGLSPQPGRAQKATHKAAQPSITAKRPHVTQRNPTPHSSHRESRHKVWHMAAHTTHIVDSAKVLLAKVGGPGALERLVGGRSHGH